MSAHAISNSIRAACSIASIGLLLVSIQAARAGDASRPDQMSVETLKSVYLDCERSASQSRLETGDVMNCSLVYEELKRQAFGGDFGRIRSWLASRSSPMG